MALQFFVLSSLSLVVADDPATFHCVGNCASPVRPSSAIKRGQALCGGAMAPGEMQDSDLDVYRWMLNRSMGGDFLVLTADPASTPCDLYNEFIWNLTGVSHRPNSVTTICFNARAGAFDRRTVALLAGASAVFMTGGDQSLYYKFWNDSPVSLLLPHVPLLGGESAGLAVQGEFVYDALSGGVVSGITSDVALARPFDPLVQAQAAPLRKPRALRRLPHV